MTRSLLLMVTVSTLMLSACQSDPLRGPSSPVGDPLAVGGYPQVTMAAGLVGLLAHSAPMVEPSTPSRPLNVIVPVRSVQDGPTRVQYQFTWLDSSGRPIGESGWKYEFIPPRMERFFESSALTTRAENWRLEIKVAS
jgi:uncharacterized protein YcfL